MPGARARSVALILTLALLSAPTPAMTPRGPFSASGSLTLVETRPDRARIDVNAAAAVLLWEPSRSRLRAVVLPTPIAARDAAFVAKTVRYGRWLKSYRDKLEARWPRFGIVELSLTTNRPRGPEHVDRVSVTILEKGRQPVTVAQGGSGVLAFDGGFYPIDDLARSDGGGTGWSVRFRLDDEVEVSGSVRRSFQWRLQVSAEAIVLD